MLQIDLNRLGLLRGVQLGTGWLQLWMEEGAGLVRVVPAETVANAPLTLLPSPASTDYYQRLRCNDGATSPAWLEYSCAIVGWKAPFFDYPTNELHYAIEEVEELGPPPALQNALISLKHAMDADSSQHFLHRAFGAVNESDLEACSVPPVLFVLDEGEPLRESANANDGIYVCYQLQKRNGVEFSIHGARL